MLFTLVVLCRTYTSLWEIRYLKGGMDVCRGKKSNRIKVLLIFVITFKQKIELSLWNLTVFSVVFLVFVHSEVSVNNFVSVFS